MKVLRLLRLLCVAAAAASAVYLAAGQGLLHVPGVRFAAATSPLVSVTPGPKNPPVHAKGHTVRPHFDAVSNYPRTAIMGNTETFSVRIVGRPNAPLTYILRYPNGREVLAYVLADSQGNSSYTFRLSPSDYHMTSSRVQGVTITVETDDHALRRSLPFAIDRP